MDAGKCRHCGKPTKFVRNRFNKYCSNQCHYDYYLHLARKPKRTVSCVQCGSEYVTTRPLAKYCSDRCKNIFECNKRSKKSGSKACEQCGKEYTPYTSLSKFCSYHCRNENSKAGRSKRWSAESIAKRIGKNNPAYVHGMSSMGRRMSSEGLRRFSKNRNEYIADMVDRDGHAHCELCNASSVKLEAHHIIYRSEKPGHPMLHEKINILLVCVPCHNDLHSNKWKRNELVMSRGLHEHFGMDVLDKENKSVNRCYTS